MWGKEIYSLEDVYGIGETPTDKCPTYIERNVHKSFEYTIKNEKVHIVVYGASRQGKSWLVERYCPNFIRVGCDSKFTREILFKAILHELGVLIGDVTTGSSNELSGGFEVKVNAKVGIPLVAEGTAEVKSSVNGRNTDNQQFKYLNVDLANQVEVISAINEHLEDRFIVIENFHYLRINEQKAMASTLKEFLYHKIRVIIVGIWKETTKLVSLASDLSNRCEYIDIGDWTDGELKEIARLGDGALSVITDDKIIELFIENSGYNVGIFKSLLKNFCKLNEIYNTQKIKTKLCDINKAYMAIDKSFQEVIVPVLERLNKLATCKKSGGKGLRYYILRAVTEIMSTSISSEILKGISLEDILAKVASFNGADFQSSNVKQELMVLHLREETVSSADDTTTNFVPLFYFDQGKGNGRLLIVESALIVACKMKTIDFSTLLHVKEDYVK